LPYRARASSTASTQKSASSVIETRHDNARGAVRDVVGKGVT
jgi:hypothetical protein